MNSTLVTKTLENWKQRLVDLSRKNKLLYFQPAAKSRLQVTEPSPEAVFQRVVIDEKSFQLYVPEQEESDDNLQLQPVSENPPLVQTGKPKRKSGHDEITLSAPDARTMQAAARNLFRRSIADFEERGVRILHIAFGMVEWKEANNTNTDVCRSPLVLVPIQIQRASVRSPYVITLAEEEPVLNPALEVKFKNDWRLDIPPLPEDWEETSITKYLESINKHVARFNWRVVNECWLGLFSFHKLVMYQDLTANVNPIGTHPIVKALSRVVDDDVKESLKADFPDRTRLDSILDPRNHHLVLDADSSQLACIEAAKRGSSLVVHGPPGTGKSQTIANMIADAISDGKSVLFVSEKMAALEVVFKRLKQKQLGHYCLELHSHKANKREVVQELYKCFQESLSAGKDLDKQDFEQLIHKRTLLNKYVDALHKVREPFGRSAYHVLSELAALDHISLLAGLKISWESLTPQFLDLVTDLAARLSHVWPIVQEGSSYPWYGCLVESYNLDTHATIADKLTNVTRSLDDLLLLSQEQSDQLGITAPTCLALVRHLMQIANLLQRGPGIGYELIDAADIQAWDSNLKHLKALSRNRRTIMNQLDVRYRPAIYNLPDCTRTEIDSSLLTLDTLLAAPLATDSDFLQHGKSALLWAEQTQQAIPFWIETCKCITEFFELPAIKSLNDVTALTTLAEYYHAALKPDITWFRREQIDQVKSTVNTLERYFAERNMRLSELATSYHESLEAQGQSAQSFWRSLARLEALTDHESADKAVCERKDVLSLLAKAKENLETSIVTAQTISSELGLASPKRLSHLSNLLKILDLCSATDRPEAQWFTRDGINGARSALTDLAPDLEQYHAIRKGILDTYKTKIFPIASSLAKVWQALDRARSSLRCSTQYQQTLFSQSRDVYQTAQVLKDRLQSLTQDLRVLANALGVSPQANFSEISRVLELARLTTIEFKPIASWFDPQRLHSMKNILSTVRNKLALAKQARDQVLQEYEPTIFQLEIDRMLSELRNRFDSPLRWLLPSYYKLRKQLRMVRKDGSFPELAIKDLTAVRDAQQADSDFRAYMDAESQNFGYFGNDYDTDLNAVEKALLVAGDVLRLEPNPSDTLVDQFSYDKRPNPEITKLLARMTSNLSDWQKAESQLRALVSLERLPNTNLPPAESDIPAIDQWVTELLQRIETLVVVQDDLESCLLPEVSRTPLQLFSDLRALQSLNEITQRINENSETYRKKLIGWYRDFDTDLEATNKALGVAEEVLRLTSDQVPEYLAQNVRFNSTAAPAIPLAARTIKESSKTWKEANSKLEQILQSKLATQEVSIDDFLVEDKLAWLTAAHSAVSDLVSFIGSVEALLRPGIKRSHTQILEDIQAAEALVLLQSKIQSFFETAKSVLGAWFNGYDTKLDEAQIAVDLAARVLKNFSGPPPESFTKHVTRNSVPDNHISKYFNDLQSSIAAWVQAMEANNSLLSISALPLTGIPVKNSSLPAVLEWSGQILNNMKTLLDACTTVLSCVKASDVENNNSLCPSHILEDLSHLEKTRVAASELSSYESSLISAYPNQFRGFESDWDDMLQTLAWLQELRHSFDNSELPMQVKALVNAGGGKVPSTKPITDAIESFVTDFSAFRAEFSGSWLFDITQSDSLEQCRFAILQKRLHDMGQRPDELRDWSDYRAVEVNFDARGLQEIHALLIKQRGLAANQVIPTARKLVLSSWYAHVCQQEPVLGQFRGQDHEKVLSDFKALDRKLLKFGPQRVVQSVSSRRSEQASIQPGSEASVLYREAGKKKKHLPLRKLFKEIPNLLPQLKPCLLMSPISVSQFIDAHLNQFDLLIFDEASQICSEDAVNSIYRAKQLVVCGDNKQLPPTAFFQRDMLDEFPEEENPDDIDMFDSILDECIAVGMAQGFLNWHYRSKHEDLIAFSNHRFYGSRLITFPSALNKHDSLGIKFVHVADGIYDRGGKRNNLREADVVAKLIVQHVRTSPHRSLGVIAFSSAQSDAIQDAIEQMIRKSPELEHHLSPDRLEGFFVKNLENVQGDERDVIIFSVGYGPDRDGKLSMHFGPLNLQGGERRLNVAITRAREQIFLVSSFKASQLDVQRVQSPGVLSLYHYLDYADRGMDALQLIVPQQAEDFESPLEQSVAEEIRSLGYDVVSQVGCSGFRIDLGVMHPGEPGRFVLGVECDGATYHSSATARDRDRMRQEILENKGWRIHRIWAPDWVSMRKTQIARLKLALEAARATPSIQVHTVAAVEPPSEDSAIIVSKTVPEVLDEEEADTAISWARPYKRSAITIRVPSGMDIVDPLAQDAIARMLVQVVSKEGPVHIKLAARRLTEHWGLERLSNRRREAIDSVLENLILEGAVLGEADFLSLNDGQTLNYVRTPVLDDPDTYRTIDLIPPEELQLAISNLVSESMSLPEDMLVRRVAKLFGFDRTGGIIKEIIDASVEASIEQGLLVRRGSRISASKSDILANTNGAGKETKVCGHPPQKIDKRKGR